MYRLHRRSAEAVDGDPRHALRQTRDHGNQARDVEPLLAFRERAAEHQVLDVLGLHAGLVDQALHHRRRQIVGPHLGQRALAREVEGGTDVAGDHRLAHDYVSVCRADLARSSSISTFFWILPTAVFGRSARNSTILGISIGESLSLRKAHKASVVSDSPLFSAITAFTVWPR